MSATDELRRMLDERGVEHQDHYFSMSWIAGGTLHMASEQLDGTLVVDRLTPEQAIAATLGSTAPSKVVEELRGYADRAMREGGMYFSGEYLDSLVKRAESERFLAAALGEVRARAFDEHELLPQLRR